MNHHLLSFFPSSSFALARRKARRRHSHRYGRFCPTELGGYIRPQSINQSFVRLFVRPTRSLFFSPPFSFLFLLFLRNTIHYTTLQAHRRKRTPSITGAFGGESVVAVLSLSPILQSNRLGSWGNKRLPYFRLFFISCVRK